jgi:hypothetical protein
MRIGRSPVALLDGAEDQWRGALSLLAELPHRGKPVIFVDRTAGTDSSRRVAVDDKLGSSLAATHLLELGAPVDRFMLERVRGVSPLCPRPRRS